MPARWPPRSAIRSCSRRRTAAAAAACGWCSTHRSSPRIWSRLSANRSRPSAALKCSSRNTSPAHGILRCSCWATSTGNLVHLWERDCSLQRRHQKVVEIAPAPNLDPALRRQLCESALAIGRAVRYENAGTVEFLLDVDTGQYYFIEVNPRIQVEHTVTEEVTGIDIVRSQILVAQGHPLDSPEIGITSQDEIRTNGFAFQCRVTTEDPENRFVPDYGRIAAYRSASGMGIRLDAGTAFSGAVVTPYYDSLLVKVTARGTRLVEASRRMERCLQEFRVRGVKTNIPFLINLDHASAISGRRVYDEVHRRDARAVSDGDPQGSGDEAAAILGGSAGERQFAGEGPAAKHAPQSGSGAALRPARAARRRLANEASGDRPARSFRNGFSIKSRCLLTDTTFRDAHQSLLATRMRTFDMLAIAEAYARLVPEMFSIEMWGGATFDTSMRFLKESPWQRLADLRERIPNILFQMLLRASNAVGYTNYPDNVVRAFVLESAAAGIDLFRIFDSLNWVPNMRVAMEAVLETGGLCEAAICYTGDLLDPSRPKYDLEILRRAGQAAREDGRAHPGHQRYGRTCASRTPPRSWSGRSSKRSASRSTFTRTTRAASPGRACIESGRGRAGHRRWRDRPASPDSPRNRT